MQDRAEKLAILSALDEVLVHFDGDNCEHVRWPDLYPGEQPLVCTVQAVRVDL